MWEFLLFLRDSVASITGMLDSYYFSLGGLNVSIFDLIIGFIAMSLVVAVFWKGARA